MFDRTGKILVVLIALLALFLLGSTAAHCDIIASEKLTETDLSLPFDTVKVRLSSILGTPDRDTGIAVTWKFGSYRLLVVDLDDTTYVAIRVLHIPGKGLPMFSKLNRDKKRAPVAKSLKPMWTRSIGTWQ